MDEPTPELARVVVQMEPIMLGAAAAAAVLDCSVSKLLDLRKQGIIRPIKVAGIVRYPVADLREAMQRLYDEAAD